MTTEKTESALERVEREDLVSFINAGMVATGQDEARQSEWSQRVSLGFLHEYVGGNYPRLYARCLALGGGRKIGGLNHANQARIVDQLLRRGAPVEPEARAEEAGLIALTLQRLPAPRVYRLFEGLARDRVNNRRVRVAIQRWLAERDLAFDAVKYRRGLGVAARHAHVALAGALGAFVFRGPDGRMKWQTPLFERARRARRDPKAVYDLPFTVAEGYAGLHGIPRARFLQGIQKQMTARERSRLIRASAAVGAKHPKADPGRMSLGQLCRYVLGQPPERRDGEALASALSAAADRAAAGSSLVLGSVVAVLDRGLSSAGGAARRNRPLSVALGASQLLSRISRRYTALWSTPPRGGEVMLTPEGSGHLVGPVQQALAMRPDWVIVVSDAFEEGAWGRAAGVARAFQACFGQASAPRVVLFNPVYDAEEFMPRPLGPDIPMMGLTEPEHLPTMLAFARFASGEATLVELEGWLGEQARRALERVAPRRAASAA